MESGVYGGRLLCPLYPLLAFTELTFGRINVHATLSSPNMVQVVVVVGWVRGLMEPLSEVFDMLQCFQKILPLAETF